MPEKTDQKFELRPEQTAVQTRLALKPVEPAAREPRRRKDSARLVWDSKPKRPPSPRDIEFQTAEIVIPNPARDAATLPFVFREQALRGNGKRAKVVGIEAIQSLPAGKNLTIAIRVVDIFGNDAAGTIDIRT